MLVGIAIVTSKSDGYFGDRRILFDRSGVKKVHLSASIGGGASYRERKMSPDWNVLSATPPYLHHLYHLNTSHLSPPQPPPPPPPTFHPECSMGYISLDPRLPFLRGKRAWYTLSAHASKFPEILGIRIPS